MASFPQMGKPPITHQDKILAGFLALLLFGLYMFLFDGILHSDDGLSMLAVAENVVKHGRFDTRQLENWENVAPGLARMPYSKYAVGPILFMIPFVVLAMAVPGFGIIQTTLVLMPLATALTAPFIYLSARRLGYRIGPAIFITVLAGVGTMAWSRTRDLVAEPLLLLSFTAAFYYALAWRQDRKLLQAGLMGLAVGMTVLHKVVNVAFVPFYFWYTFGPDTLNLRRVEWRTWFKNLNWPGFGASVITLGACGAIVAGYNLFRYGNILDTGYSGQFSTPVWVGFTGFLISPYKSLFLYVPLFVLVLLTIKLPWRQHRRETLLIVAMLISQMLLFGAWFSWGGGKTWGPRFLMPLDGLLLLLLLPFAASAFQPGRRRQRFILFSMSLLSILMQVLGISARDYVYLDAADFWTPPPNYSLWGELSWQVPDQWPIWGHILRFDVRAIPVIWHWQWQDISHVDPLSPAAAVFIVALGLAGLLWFSRQRHAVWGLGLAWILAFGAVAFILIRNYNDPRAIDRASEAGKIWPDYSALVDELPHLAGPADAVIFTDRRFELYLLDRDKSQAQRYLIAKANQSIILGTVPQLLARDFTGNSRIWLVTDELDNRQVARAVEYWLGERAQLESHRLFGATVQLLTFVPNLAADWSAPIPTDLPLSVTVDPDDYAFHRIAALQGWNWPDFGEAAPPVTLQAGQTYPFELYWIYRGKSPADKFFVRLTADNGRAVIAAATTVPRPDNRLVPGQYLIEDAMLTIPADIAPGTYHLQPGFFTPAVEGGELVFDLPPALTAIEIR